jgi:predicted phage terminase large subunit-like protein
MDLTQEQIDVLLRNDLSSFIERTYLHLDPQNPYQHNWHIDLLADRLAKVARGECRRLIITVPPRSLKSICASVAFPAWVLGRDPSRRIICASYSQDLSHKLARDTAAVMTSSWYQRAFSTRLQGQRTAEISTTKRGGRLATSVCGTLTGLGGDIIIIDDPVKPDEALSDTVRANANHWFDNTVYSRLNDKRTGAIIVIMQRLHLDDLVGHVLEKEPWEVVNLPAIAQEQEVWEYTTFLGPKRRTRQPDELLHAHREPPEILQGIRNTLGEFAFSAQYLQAPVPLGGGLIKREWLHRYEGELTSANFSTVVQSWDTANKASELSDYSVCTTWGVKDKKAYLLHVLRKRLDYPDLKRTMIEHARIHRAKTVLVEDKASGTQLIQELSRGELPSIKGVKPKGDKVMRMQAQTPYLENGFVLLPERAPWLEEYLAELTTFPQSRYDDQVDSTSQALEWISIGRKNTGVLEYYKRLAEEQCQAGLLPAA